MSNQTTAAERTQAAADNAAALLTDAKDRLIPFLDQSRDRLTPLIDQSRERLTPLAAEARARGTDYAHQAADAVGPAVAAAKLAARERYIELAPRLTDALENLANDPSAQAVQNRGVAALHALKGDLQLSKKEQKRLHKSQLAQIQALRSSIPEGKSKKKKSIAPLLILVVLGGLGYVVWKKFFAAPSDSAWQEYTPAPAPKAAPADAPAETSADSFVGANPPAGFAIKGNERSKTYYTTDAEGYERTIADIWFATEAAAQAAGFSKAQR